MDYLTYNKVAEELAFMWASLWESKNPKEQFALVIKVWVQDHLPILKEIIKHRKEAEANLRKTLKEQEAEKEKKKIEKKRKYHSKMSALVYKAEAVYGDACYEYAIQLWGEDGPEYMTSGAKEFSDGDEDMLMGEAIYAAFSGDPRMDTDYNFVDKIKKYWKKYHI